MRALLRLALLGLTLVADAAQSRPFAVDDLLRLQSVAAVAADPTGRWLVFQYDGPYEDGPRFDDFGYIGWRSSQLLGVDLAHPAAARPLFPQGKDAGYVPGPFSPDGQRLLVFRRQDRRWEAGIVTLARGEVRWLAGTPELSPYGRAAQWRSPSELVMITRPDNSLPRHLRAGAEGMAELPKRWATTAGGGASVTAIGSGRFQAVTPAPIPGLLVRIDAEAGTVTALAAGGFFDLEISPSGRYAAVLEDGAPLPRQIAVPDSGEAPLRHRSLRLVDLATGQSTTPCPDLEILTHLLAWSPRSNRLLVFARNPGETSRAGRFVLIDAANHACFDLRPAGLRPVVSRNGESTPYASGAWLGDDPVILADRAAGRADWYRLTSAGPLNLTAGFGSPARRLAAASPTALWLRADGGLWRLSARESAVQVASGDDLQVVAPRGFMEGQRLVLNTAPDAARAAAVTMAGGGLRVQPLDGRPPQNALPALDPAARIEIATAFGVVTCRRDDHGVETYDAVDRRGVATRLLAANPQLASIDFAEVAPVSHVGPAGEALTSWLYLPRHRQAGARLPLVVAPYPGEVNPEPPESAAPGRFQAFTNVQLLVGQGYAVLVPSLPRDEARGEPADGLAAQILAVVDAALGRGDLDPQRLALWGHSFGGFASMAVATQTDRFKSIIASDGIADWIAYWDNAEPGRRVTPTDGPAAFAGVRATESLQPSLGAPPWRDPQRYLRNSPLFAADRVTTPILLLHGDQDEVQLGQSEAMYAALWRQNKDAELAIYWGEHHTVDSPGNIRDLYGRVFSWLARTLPSP